MIFQSIFCISLLLVLLSYIIYPLFLFLLYPFFRKKEERQTTYPEEKKIAVLMAVHNEESVIAKKIESIYAQVNPYSNFEVFIGSDCSNDKTNEILAYYSALYKSLSVRYYPNRMGKAKIINELVGATDADILVITDANVFFSEFVLPSFNESFLCSSVGLVESNVYNTGLDPSGISHQEGTYIRLEKKLKKLEGDMFGRLMGPFGGCYAIRRELYVPVPEYFVVDDFYICMNVLLQGRRSIACSSAVVLEDVSNNLSDEFRRKTRISIGNFQNLRYFAPKILQKDPKGFLIFFLHKILRWLTPFLILFSFISSCFLLELLFYRVAFLLSIMVLAFSFIDFILRKADINILLFRFATHFLSMNLALFIGFILYLKGVKTNVWQPTKRNQSAKIDA